LNLEASLTGGFSIRTGRLGVSMRFKGPEEVGVVVVSRTPEPSLVGVFASGASPSDAASPSKEARGCKAVAKVFTVVPRRMGLLKVPH
jgi:hypothetical protein